MKRTISLLLTLLLLIGMVPAGAFAKDLTDSFLTKNSIGGYYDENGVKLSTTPDDHYVYYDVLTKTITLKNIDISGDGGVFDSFTMFDFYTERSSAFVKFVLIGKNSIRVLSGMHATGIYANGLEITSEDNASLDITVVGSDDVSSHAIHSDWLVISGKAKVSCSADFPVSSGWVYGVRIVSGAIVMRDFAQLEIFGAKGAATDAAWKPATLSVEYADPIIRAGASRASVADVQYQEDYPITGKYFSVRPGNLITSLDFELDIPNDGEELPNGTAGIARVTKVPKGVKVTGTESVMFAKIFEGKAAAGDNLSFGITYEVLDGYEIASNYTATINGKTATKILTPGGVRKVALVSEVICNPTITITEDIPETIEFEAGEDITASISATGKSIKYQWQLLETSASGGGAKQKFSRTVTDIPGAVSADLKITGADSSYNGKGLRCLMSNSDGNTYSVTATLKLVGSEEQPHIHTFTPGYNDDEHWEKCSCGEVKLMEDHELTVKSDAENHWNECDCGYQTEKVDHRFGDWTVTKEATDKTAGSRERVCTVCKYKEVDAIPATVQYASSTPFIDVPYDTYYYDATVWAFNAEPQITDGNGKDKFMPEQICNRGQVVTFLWRAAGEPAPKSTKNPFADVKSTDYFYYPVLWAVENGITDGTDATHFSPDNPCRNSHILTFIYRAMGEPDKTGEGTWYTDACNWANFGGLLDGTYAGTFDTDAECPRKNVVQYLYKYYTMQ